jgi:hypothetical protein
VAHASDTLFPSLLSGLDRGARIVALTNLIAPDIFTPGNQGFDCLERMGANFAVDSGAAISVRSLSATACGQRWRRTGTKVRFRC